MAVHVGILNREHRATRCGRHRVARLTQQVAEELSIAPVTVNTHKTVLLNHCHAAWNIPYHERLDYHFLTAKFGSYFTNDE